MTRTVICRLNMISRSELTNDIKNWVREECLPDGYIFHSPIVVDQAEHLISLDEAVWQLFTLHDGIRAAEYCLDFNVCRSYVDSGRMTVILHISAQPHVCGQYPLMGFFVKVVVDVDNKCDSVCDDLDDED